jgi:hypothetical protein
MAKDPIVEEVHRARRKLVERFDHDLDAICADARERETTSGHPVVTLPRKRARVVRPARGRSR